MDLLQPSAKGKRSLIQLLDPWADTQPEKIRVSYPLGQDISKGFCDVTHREIRDAADTFAWWLLDTYGRGVGFETIAYVGVNDLRYPLVFFGAIKAGYKSLFLSPRNPTSTNASLLEQTKCRHLLFSPEMASVAKSIAALWPDIDIAQIASFDHWLDTYHKPFHFNKSFEETKWDPILVLHSSGSIGIPKPITLPNGFFAATNAAMRPILGRSMSGTAALSFDVGGFYFSPFPPFHLAGANALIYQPLIALEASAIIAQKAQSPIFASKFDRIDQPDAGWSRGAGACESVIYAGGPLSKACGDQLAHHVKLSTVYGATETGNNHMLVPPPEDWDYIEFHPGFLLRMESTVDGASELVFSQDDPNNAVRGISWTYPHLRNYRTRDMFMPHPSKAGVWKFYSRNDDIIVFSNGAKYNPVPAESVIASNEKLTGVLILGGGRTQTVALLEPKEEEPSTQLIEELWPYIERANEHSQKQGHLTRSKIAIVPPGSLIRAAKGTVVRALTYDKFKESIENLYLEDNSEAFLSPRLQPTTEGSLSTAVLMFVRECVKGVPILINIDDDEDFYVRGLDSVQTVELVRMLRAGVKSQYGNVPWLTAQLIFECPTIHGLAGALEQGIKFQPTHGSHDTSAESRPVTNDRIAAMIAKYSRDFHQPIDIATQEPPAGYGEVGLHAILTGSTGSLGLRIFQKLVNDPAIASATCLDRSSDARARVVAVAGILDGKEVTFLQANFGEAYLGLKEDDYATLKSNTHVVFHTAWKVDFNQALESFEPVHIRGVTNLISLSYASMKRARIVFISSTSSVGKWTSLHAGGEPVPEKVIEDLAVAANMGYGQSKFVGEHILANASRSSAGRVPVSILRVGQVAGPVDDAATEGPLWNDSEWFSTLLKTSKELRCLPQNLAKVDWIPVDRLASIICEIAKTDIENSPFVDPQAYNLVNFQSVGWDEVIRVVQNRLAGPETCPAISLDQWLRELKKMQTDSHETLTQYPALKLIPFFKSMTRILPGNDLELTTKKGQEASNTFRTLTSVQLEWLEAWMAGWNL